MSDLRKRLENHINCLDTGCDNSKLMREASERIAELEAVAEAVEYDYAAHGFIASYIMEAMNNAGYLQEQGNE